MNFDISSFESRAAEVVAWLEHEFAGVRTGQATPGLLDGVRVNSYGADVPLNQVGTVGVEDARTLRISVWDASQVGQVEQAIRDANLGLSVVSDDAGVRVIFPELTGERRAELAKLAKTKYEAARVSLRGARDEMMKAVETAEKNGDLSEDEKFRVKEAIQKKVDEFNQKLDGLFEAKESQITTV